jgi:hypothetical protein
MTGIMSGLPEAVYSVCFTTGLWRRSSPSAVLLQTAAVVILCRLTHQNSPTASCAPLGAIRSRIESYFFLFTFA